MAREESCVCETSPECRGATPLNSVLPGSVFGGSTSVRASYLVTVGFDSLPPVTQEESYKKSSLSSHDFNILTI